MLNARGEARQPRGAAAHGAALAAHVNKAESIYFDSRPVAGQKWIGQGAT